MKEISIKELIENNRVKFEFYRASVMYYSVPHHSGIYQFPVRLDDIGDATLLKEDKAILFMRWIRKAKENNELEKI